MQRLTTFSPRQRNEANRPPPTTSSNRPNSTIGDQKNLVTALVNSIQLPSGSLESHQLTDQQQELQRLRQQCQALQQSCQDKDEQLRAVSNNRTILHSALQASLQQREQEIASLQQKTSDREARTAEVLEDLVRADACQEAREIREKLAADGARLGRIVTATAPSRVPSQMLMQRVVMESWEDGHASKLLQNKRADLQARRATLVERQKAALQAEERVLKQQLASPGAIETLSTVIKGDPISSGESAETSNTDNDPIIVGGVEVCTVLDAREAIEFVHWHLSNIHQKEKELAIEEQALNDEKGAHIRALKRVASEDAPRFRNRPKLHARYVLQSLLGKGGFSEVWRAYNLEELREVAVKIHQLDSRWPDAKKESYTKHVSREYEIQRNVRHPRIVSLYDVFEIDNNSFATVLECCDGTDLDTLLKTKRRLPERDARAILLQIFYSL